METISIGNFFVLLQYQIETKNDGKNETIYNQA
jgi:hypothetical protein